MNKLICSVFIFLFFSLSINAQTWQWGRRGGGNNGINPENEKVIDMATDKNGNLYLLAQLGGGGDATLSTENGDSLLATRLYGGKDVALISYDCSGKLRWTKIFGSQYNDNAAGMSMDTLGHIYVAIQVSDTLNVDVDSVARATNIKYGSLIQYDTAGNFKWLRQPAPDSVKRENAGYYGVANMATMPNGDTYLLCGFFRTGLISGSTSMVVTTPGYYMLKYNVAGVPKELIKVDMTQASNGFFSYTNFSVTNSRKFIFTGRRNNGSSQTSYPIVGGQFVKHPIFLCCFSQTGNVLWRIEDKDTIGGSISGRPQIDETKGLIYLGGYANGVYGDTIQNFVIKNSFTSSFFRGLPFIMAVDTLGVVKLLKNGHSYRISCLVNDLKFRSDGRLFVIGNGAGLLWDGFKFDNGKFIGEHIFMPSFDATTGTVLSMDSLLGSADATYASVMTADNKNNIYVAGEMTYDVKVGSQTLVANGGVTDFFIAKYGFADCNIITPLKFGRYYITNNRLDKNNWDIKNKWETYTESNQSHFNILRSFDGVSFKSIGKIAAKNWGENEYEFVDKLHSIDLPVQSSFRGYVYYKIESVDREYQKFYTETKRVKLNEQQETGNIVLYPNPAKDIVNIECKDGIKEVKLFNPIGKQIATGTNLRNDGNLKLQTLNLQQVSKGLYLVKVLTNKNEINNVKLLVE